LKSFNSPAAGEKEKKDNLVARGGVGDVLTTLNGVGLRQPKPKQSRIFRHRLLRADSGRKRAAA